LEGTLGNGARAPSDLLSRGEARDFAARGVVTRGVPEIWYRVTDYQKYGKLLGAAEPSSSPVPKGAGASVYRTRPVGSWPRGLGPILAPTGPLGRTREGVPPRGKPPLSLSQAEEMPLETFGRKVVSRGTSTVGRSDTNPRASCPMASWKVFLPLPRVLNTRREAVRRTRD